MRSTSQPRHPLRRLFLAWVILVYLWGLVLLTQLPKQMIECLHGTAPKNFCTLPGSLAFPLQATSLWQLSAFTALMLLHGGGLWLSLGGWLPQRFSWHYFLFQGGLVFLLGFVMPGNVVISLYLVLALQALSQLQQTRLVLGVASSLLILFTLSFIWNVWTWEYGDWGNFFVRVVSGTDYTALLPFVAGYLILYAQQVRSHTQLATAHVKLEETHRQLQAATVQIEELTLVAERQRMARELHDTLAQSLAGLVRQLDIVNLHLVHQRSEHAREIVQDASASARGALTAARCAIDDLRTTTATPGDLIEMVQEEIERFTTATGIPCVAELEALEALPVSLYEHARKAIGEGLTNITRHAQARQVWVCTKGDENTLTIDIRDDGIGFSPSEVAAQTGHYGLLGLRERTRLAGGQVEISSTKGAGTSLRLQFPTTHQEALS
jgi:two-component system, NarL family, sensor histidine kinase YdfH